MSEAAHALAAEFARESAITRRVLERVPTDRLEWQPHTKSMTLGQLAQHIALIPASMVRLSQLNGLDMATRRFEHAQGESTPAILATFDASVATAKAALTGLEQGAAKETWRMTAGDREIFSMPRIDMMRLMGMHHQIHHRGELVVYLRLLDVPVPIVYGRSADEQPFAQQAAV
ncbi:MAG TPA: DinB family protein [Vicinamibacterales bacterium]